MKYTNSVIVFTLLTTALFSVNANAQQKPSVQFNEIAWMGTTESSNNEWIELYNTTNNPVDITGWTLKALDGSPNIILKGTIPAHRFFMLERTDDDSAPTLADQIYTGSLNNNGERLQLFDTNNALIDDVNGWTTGDNETKITMARGQNNEWRYGVVDGTPNAQNKFFDPPQTNDPNTAPATQQDSVSNAPVWISVLVVFVVVGFVVIFVLPHTHPRKHREDKREEEE